SDPGGSGSPPSSNIALEAAPAIGSRLQMANCKVVLLPSFEQALAQIPEHSQDQLATVIQALEWDCEFNPDPEQYILEISEHVVACEHVEGWGWSLFWYREGD